MKAVLTCSFAAATILFFLFTMFIFQQNNSWLMALRSNNRQSITGGASAYVTIPSVTVSLSGRETHFCRAGFTLDVAKRNLSQLKESKYIGFMQDSIADIVSSYAMKPLLTHEGKMRLKRHIRTDINKGFTAAVVKNVYYRKFILE
jgi:flagellar basal body-associated protein FliL